MIVSGWIILVIGVLSFFGRAIGSAGLTIYAYIVPIIGIVLLIFGYKRKKNKKEPK